MRKILLNVVGSIVGLALFLTPFFVYGWIEHTGFVQEIVQESMDDFKQDDIDWVAFDFYVDDEQVLLEQIRSVLLANSSLFRIDAIREENTAYKEVLYDMIHVLVNDPIERKGLVHFAAAQRQAELDRDHQRFQDSTLYAMRFIF